MILEEKDTNVTHFALKMVLFYPWMHGYISK